MITYSPARSLVGRTLVYLVLLYLASCSSKQRHSDLQEVYEPQEKRWGLSGKISLKVGNQTKRANLRWINEDDDYEIHLYGPFGQGKIDIYKRGETITLERGGTSQSAESAQALLQKTTGLELPIESLRYWIRGLAAPDAPAEKTLDLDGDLAELVQQGWIVTYFGYDIFENGRGEVLLLPNKLKLAKNDYSEDSADELVPVRATIVVKEWQP